MNKAKNLVERFKIGLAIGILATLTGCATFGYEDYYGSEVYAPGPDIYLFGGDFDRGHDVRHFSNRGHESRGVVHSGGGQRGRR
jgi:hypothetical protein